MSLVIGPATVHDLASVALIERAAFSDPWSLRSFREALDSAHDTLEPCPGRD